MSERDTRSTADRPRRAPRSVALASLLTVAAVATSVLLISGRDSQPAQAAPSGEAATTGGGKLAPDFRIRTVEGRSFSLAAQRGKVVALDFLQAGCPSCAAEVPVLSKLATRFAARRVAILVIDVSGLGDRALRKYYRGKLGASRKLLIAADRGFRVARAYRLTAIPLAYVIGRDGRLLWQGSVESDKSDFVEAIERRRS